MGIHIRRSTISTVIQIQSKNIKNMFPRMKNTKVKEKSMYIFIYLYVCLELFSAIQCTVSKAFQVLDWSRSIYIFINIQINTIYDVIHSISIQWPCGQALPPCLGLGSHVPLYVSIYLFLHLSIDDLCVALFMYLCSFLFIHLSIYLCIYSLIYPSILFVCIYLSIYASFH